MLRRPAFRRLTIRAGAAPPAFSRFLARSVAAAPAGKAPSRRRGGHDEAQPSRHVIRRGQHTRQQGRPMRAAKVPPKKLRRVVIAASVGNIIEWYDFYIFGSLAAILAVKFFEKGHPVAAFLSTVAIFSVGF